VRQQASIGVPANHFPTPSEGDGLLLAPSADRVIAFAAAASAAPATSPAAPSTAAAARPSGQPRAAGGSGIPAAAIAGIVAGGLAVIAGIGWLLWRRVRGAA
jgi:hypothetical protein